MMLTRNIAVMQPGVAGPVAVVGSKTSRVAPSSHTRALSQKEPSIRPKARKLTCMALQPLGDVSLILPSFVPILARAVTGSLTLGLTYVLVVGFGV